MGLGGNRGMRGPKKINPSSGVGRLLRFEGGKILDFGCLGRRPFLVFRKNNVSGRKNYDFLVIFGSKTTHFELGPECRPELFEVYLGILPGPFLGPPWAPLGPMGPYTARWVLHGAL